MRKQCHGSKQENDHVMPSRREALIARSALVAAPFLGGVTWTLRAAQGANVEWLSYGADNVSRRAQGFPQPDFGQRPSVGGWASPAPRVIRNTGEDSDSGNEMSEAYCWSQSKTVCMLRQPRPGDEERPCAIHLGARRNSCMRSELQ